VDDTQAAKGTRRVVSKAAKQQTPLESSDWRRRLDKCNSLRMQRKVVDKRWAFEKHVEAGPPNSAFAIHNSHVDNVAHRSILRVSTVRAALPTKVW